MADLVADAIGRREGESPDVKVGARVLPEPHDLESGVEGDGVCEVDPSLPAAGAWDGDLPGRVDSVEFDVKDSPGVWACRVGNQFEFPPAVRHVHGVLGPFPGFDGRQTIIPFGATHDIDRFGHSISTTCVGAGQVVVSDPFSAPIKILCRDHAGQLEWLAPVRSAGEGGGGASGCSSIWNEVVAK